jgi:hypothetical protein
MYYEFSGITNIALLQRTGLMTDGCPADGPSHAFPG